MQTIRKFLRPSKARRSGPAVSRAIKRDLAERAHSPSPWEVREGTSNDGIYSGDFCVAVVKDGTARKTNACLISAAPELLKATKLFQRFFDEMPKGQFGKMSCDIGLMNDAFLASAAAIAKTEGR